MAAGNCGNLLGSCRLRWIGKFESDDQSAYQITLTATEQTLVCFDFSGFFVTLELILGLFLIWVNRLFEEYLKPRARRLAVDGSLFYKPLKR